MAGKIAIQLYTVRNELEQDFSGTLSRLAQIGYQGVETYGNFFGGYIADDVRALMNSLGLQLSGSHANIRLLGEKLDELIAFNVKAGCPHLVCSKAEFQTLEDVKNTADFFNLAGEKCREQGMSFHYHNHGHEFEYMDSKMILDTLLELTNPELVGLELDVYWAAKAGVKPTLYQARWQDRSRLLHCKDMEAGTVGSYADVGAGVIDFPAIFAAAPLLEWFVVEHDNSPDPMKSAETSFSALAALLSRSGG